jgi:hypothetical protein
MLRCSCSGVAETETDAPDTLFRGEELGEAAGEDRRDELALGTAEERRSRLAPPPPLGAAEAA